MFRVISSLIVASAIAACAADQPADGEATASDEAAAGAPEATAGSENAPATTEEPVAGAQAMTDGMEEPHAGMEGTLIGAVEIVEPADGAVVGSDVQVTLSAVGVEIEPATSTRVEGRGHLHLFVDQDLTTPGQPIPAGVDGIIHLGDGSVEYSLTDLAPGEHRLVAVVGYGNHVPMERVATDTVDIVVQTP